MNAKFRDIAILAIVAGAGYFIYKEFAHPAGAAAKATSNASPASAASTNLLSSITGIFGIGQAGQPTTPATLATGLDNLYESVIATNAPGSSPSLDSSGGNGDDTGGDQFQG